MRVKDVNVIKAHELILNKTLEFLSNEEKLKLIETMEKDFYNYYNVQEVIEVLLSFNIDKFTDYYLKDRRVGIQKAIAKLGRPSDLSHFFYTKEDIALIYIENIDQETLNIYIQELYNKQNLKLSNSFVKKIASKIKNKKYKNQFLNYFLTIKSL